jgi:hypothetical protein
VAVTDSSIYVAGIFYSDTARFGRFTLANSPRPTGDPTAYDDGFVAKLTARGDSAAFRWAQPVSGPTHTEVRALAVRGANVYVAGMFSGSSLTLGTTIANSGLFEGFVSKLVDQGSTGRFAWAQSMGGDQHEYATAVAVGDSGVYVAGIFNSNTARLGSTTLTNVGSSSSDVFVAKLTDSGPTGRFVWAVRGGGSYQEDTRALAVSGSNVYLAGTFRSATAGFGTSMLANANPTAFTNDVFVAKLTDSGATGTFTWAKQAGGPDDDYAYAVAVGGSNVYVTGLFFGPALTLGTTRLLNANPTTVSRSFTADVFVGKLTDSGRNAQYAWAVQAGGGRDDVARAVVLNGPNVWVGGFATPPASFSGQVLPNPAGLDVGFLAALHDPTLVSVAVERPARDFSLAPNPAHTQSAFTLAAEAEARQVLLIDPLGREVRRQLLPARATTATLDLRGLAPGLYVVRCGAATGKLVVE